MHDCSPEAIEAATGIYSDGVTGQFKDLTLSSHFQPIVSLAHRRAVGHEALLRVSNAANKVFAPNLLFERAEPETEVVFLDRLARNLHVRNFLPISQDSSWLFLNVNARVAMRGRTHGAYFEHMLATHGLPPHRVVVELIENDIQDEGELAEAMCYYRDLGCLVAIDDFGAGHSNFERIWRIQPQIVKVDRTAVVQAKHNPKVRRVLPSLISLLHEAGCLTLIEGIETEEEALIALDAGTDFAQGFYFGRPAPAQKVGADYAALVASICERHLEISQASRARTRSLLAPYIAQFRDSAGMAAFDMDIRDAARSLLALPNVLRCYLLDEFGRQVGESVRPPDLASSPDRRFDPVTNVEKAVWSRRPYFQRAMAESGQVQISRPYLSITDAHMCVTLSVSVRNPMHRERVFCVDIGWEDASFS